MLEIVFKDKKLSQLYEGQKITDKKYRYDKALVKQFQKTVFRLQSVGRIEDLYAFTGLNYEKLKGSLKGKSSVRINKQYRLIFEETISSDNPLEVSIIGIEEISKHYE